MPECYLLAIAQNSTLDKTNNTWSLYNLLEQIQIETAEPFASGETIRAPLEIHVYWELNKSEQGVEFQFRLVSITEEGERVGEKLFPLKSDKPRHRFRLLGLEIYATGRNELRVEWRKKGGRKWHRSSAYSPLTVEVVQK